MAPEIMVLPESSTGGLSTEKRRIAYDAKCDTYSFGLLLWEVMHGSVVFEELTAVEVAKKVLKGERPRMSLQPGRSRFAFLITQCWHQDTKERPSMDTCAHVLGQILQLPEVASEMEAGVSAALVASRARSALRSGTSMSSLLHRKSPLASPQQRQQRRQCRQPQPALYIQTERWLAEHLKAGRATLRARLHGEQKKKGLSLGGTVSTLCFGLAMRKCHAKVIEVRRAIAMYAPSCMRRKSHVCVVVTSTVGYFQPQIITS